MTGSRIVVAGIPVHPRNCLFAVTLHACRGPSLRPHSEHPGPAAPLRLGPRLGSKCRMASALLDHYSWMPRYVSTAFHADQLRRNRGSRGRRLGREWESRRERERENGRFQARDLFADTRRSQPVLDFISTTDMGRLVLAEDNAQSEESECERRERREGEEERRQEVEGLALRTVSDRSFLPHLLHGLCGRGVGGEWGCFLYFFCRFLGVLSSSWDRPGRGKGEFAMRRYFVRVYQELDNTTK